MADPELKKAMQEIKAILSKYDIAGSITLISTSHSEFWYELSPSWSVVKFEGQKFRFRSKKQDFSSAQEQHLKTESSVHMLCQIRDIAGLTFSQMSIVLEELSKIIEIKHEPFKNFEP